MAKNPSPMSMDDTAPDNGGHNDGFVTKDVERGTLITGYGKDGSGMAGSAAAERQTMRGMGGGVNDISHSLTGCSVNQTGKSK